MIYKPHVNKQLLDVYGMICKPHVNKQLLAVYGMICKPHHVNKQLLDVYGMICKPHQARSEGVAPVASRYSYELAQKSPLRSEINPSSRVDYIKLLQNILPFVRVRFSKKHK